jgi:hypothetical protein
MEISITVDPSTMLVFPDRSASQHAAQLFYELVCGFSPPVYKTKGLVLPCSVELSEDGINLLSRAFHGQIETLEYLSSV